MTRAAKPYDGSSPFLGLTPTSAQIVERIIDAAARARKRFDEHQRRQPFRLMSGVPLESYNKIVMEITELTLGLIRRDHAPTVLITFGANWSIGDDGYLYREWDDTPKGT